MPFLPRPYQGIPQSGVDAKGRIRLNAHLHSDSIGDSKPNARHILSQPIGILPYHANGSVPIKGADSHGLSLP